MKVKHHLVIVLDQSGSMSCIAQSAITSFNEQVQTARSKSKDFDMCVTLVLFNYDIHFIKIAEPIDSIKELTSADYCPDGATALNDAVSAAIESTKEWVTKQNGKTDVLVCIISDGEENHSVKYPGVGNRSLAELIQTMQSKHGWTFTYAGTSDINVNKIGQSLNIPVHNIMKFDRSEQGARGFTSEHTAGLNTYYTTRVASFYSSTPDQCKADNKAETIDSFYSQPNKDETTKGK
jgi:hypothetical protein